MDDDDESSRVGSVPSQAVSAALAQRRYKATLMDTRTRHRTRGYLYLDEQNLVFESRRGRRTTVPLEGLRAVSSGIPRSRGELEHGRYLQERTEFGWRPFGGFGWYNVTNWAWWRVGICFYHRTRMRLCLHTNDLSILEDPLWSLHPDTQARVLKARPFLARTRRVLWWSMVASLIVLIAVPQVRRPVVGMVAEQVPIEYEVRLGDRVYHDEMRSIQVIDHPELNAQIAQITNRLLAALPEEDKRFNYRVHISERQEVNAFALPGGHIVIFSGLILEAESAEEVAGVIAHEMAHVAKRHTIRGFVQAVGLSCALWAVAGAENSEVAWMVQDYGAAYGSKKFSRDDEREADETGWAYLESADIDPRGLRDFFVRLHVQEGDPGEIDLEAELRRTHPSHAERVAYLKKLAEQAKPARQYAMIDLNWERTQRLVKMIINVEPEEAPPLTEDEVRVSEPVQSSPSEKKPIPPLILDPRPAETR